MRDIIIRPGESADDKSRLRDWLAATPGQNLFDADVLEHGSTFTLCAFDESGPLVYVPVQRPMIMESLAIRPELDDARRALALAQLTKATILRAYDFDAPEIYIHGHDPRTVKFAGKHRFTEVPWPLYRINLRESFGA